MVATTCPKNTFTGMHRPTMHGGHPYCLNCGARLDGARVTAPRAEVTARVLPERPAEERIRALGADGILTADDLASLTAAKRAIYELLRDGEWHSADEIRRVAGGQSEGLRRLRELRPYGIVIERKAVGRLFYYRIKR
jgi:hypothetical protein